MILDQLISADDLESVVSSHRPIGGIALKVQLFLIALIAAAIGRTALAHKPPSRCVVGAIRWDAWVGDRSNVGLAVEKTLSPQHWHYRLPFYAREISDTSVQVRGDNQSVMDREITYATNAGLDYWAFVVYDSDDAITRGGLDLYLASALKKDLHFSVILEGSRWDGDPANLQGMQARLIRYFKDASYQTVCGNRPLVFLLQSAGVTRQTVDSLRSESIATGIGDPYLVAMEWSPEGARAAIDRLGLNAASSYSSNGGKKGAAYSDLVSYTQWNWDAYARANPQVVPWVTTGWDRRPRLENPVFWETQYGQGVYYEPARPAEIADHLRAAIRWNAKNSAQAAANAVIIYAWNEMDEGGWLVPTLSEKTARLDALRTVLR